MTSFQTDIAYNSRIQNYSLPSELLLEKKPPKCSILKNKGQASFRNNATEIVNNPASNRKKTKLSFNSPVSKTIPVENWKEYNADTANKEEELCICALF